jgi:photosystem II stability/assembly factor-like uncharacterized protein
VTGTEETLTSALELAPGRFVLAGMAGTVLWSTGEAAPLRLQELPDRKAIVAMAPADDRALVLVGEGGVHRLDIPR